MGLWTDVVGTVRGYIRLGLTGVRLKDSSGALAVRNAGDSADASVTCAGITLSDKATFADGTLLNSSPTGQFKNKIIGGDFSLNPWQRGTSFTAPTSGSYTADRFAIYKTTSAVVNILKTADAPTAAEAGMFTQHCLHADVTTGASMGASDFYMVGQYVEGYNAAAFGFGQSGARYVTLSFWVKSTKTGTFCICATNSAWNRSYIAEYTVSSSDTWEKKTVTFAVDTSGTWLYDSGIGLRIYWVLACGSLYHTTAGSWQAGTYYATANQVNALDSASNDFKIALVQLESGSVATPFETRARAQERVLVGIGDITLGTPVASTSGTSIDFTDIPSGTKRITINFAEVSTNGTSNLLVQLGDSGGIENTGYSSGATNDNKTRVTSTAGFVVTSINAAHALHSGRVTLELLDADTFTWVSAGQICETGSGMDAESGGSKSLSAELDRVRITTVGGTSTFDAGKINITYES